MFLFMSAFLDSDQAELTFGKFIFFAPSNVAERKLHVIMLGIGI